jgi:hypothetical protein
MKNSARISISGSIATPPQRAAGSDLWPQAAGDGPAALVANGAMAIQVKRYDDPGDLPVRVAVRPLPVDPSDFRLRYKTTDRRFLDLTRQRQGAMKRSSSIPTAS